MGGATPEGGGSFLRIYELLYIVQPELDEEALGNMVSAIQQAITANGGEILDLEELGRRGLAYPIKHRLEGFYVLLHARMNQQAIVALERALRLSEDVLRYLLIQVEISGDTEEAQEADVDVEADTVSESQGG
jgi:small subunit ribosomal protein S6